MGGEACWPSACGTPSRESFQPWFSSPRSVLRWYSTKPSPSLSPYSSIQRSAASAAGNNALPVSRSSVHIRYSAKRMRKSGVESTLP